MVSAAADAGDQPAALLLQEAGPLPAQAAATLRLTLRRQPRDALYTPWQLQRLAAPTGETAEAIDRAAHVTALLLPED